MTYVDSVSVIPAMCPHTFLKVFVSTYENFTTNGTGFAQFKGH